MDTPLSLVRHTLHIPTLLLISLSFGCGSNDTPRTPNEHLVLSAVWYQTSGEMRALSYQAYTLARLRLDEDLSKRKNGKGRAVVVDIDETVLDNSPHTAKMIVDGKGFPYGWTEWVNAAKARPLPGAVEFLAYASSKGYRVVYISNRSARGELEGTMKNLQEAGCPQAEPENLLLKEDVSGKDPRRARVQETHEIVLLLGDNLNDFASVFEKRSVADRSAAVDSLRSEFGKRFIVFPNPMYGDWESAVYDHKRSLTSEVKARMRRDALRPF